ncbi:hypothetical protein OAC90_01165 [Planktomarina sp.]|nr:hypothetical protein [Planktomarina sp.]
MDKQKQVIENLFEKMFPDGGPSNTENYICSYNWQSNLDNDIGFWELNQSSSHIILAVTSLKFKSFAEEEVIFLLNRLNHHNRRGTFFLTSDGTIYVENWIFYGSNFYPEEEISSFILDMVDQVSFLHLAGENYFKNNLELEEAVQNAIQFLSKTEK